MSNNGAFLTDGKLGGRVTHFDQAASEVTGITSLNGTQRPAFELGTVGIINDMRIGVYGFLKANITGSTTVTLSASGTASAATDGAYVIGSSVSVSASSYCWMIQVAQFPT